MKNTPHVTSEWGQLRVAVMHPTLSDNELSEPQRKRAQEHARILRALEKFGVQILQVPATDRPYSANIFARDALYVVGQEAFLPHVNARSREFHQAYRIALEQWMGTAFPPTFSDAVDGGDVLLLPDNKILIGTCHTRDDDDPWAERVSETAERFENYMQKRGWLPTHILHEASHIDCAIAPLPNGEIWVHDQQLTYNTRKNINRILDPHSVHEIPSKRIYSPNILWINPQTALVSDADAASALQEKGYVVIHIPVPTIEELGGSIRCCVGVLLRDRI